MSAFLLETEHLSAGYGGPVVRDVTLRVPAGRLVAVVGPNGSGKSTLLHTMLGLLRPLGGRVTWLGVPLERWRRRELAKHVALLGQRPTADPAMTVRDVLAEGRLPHWSTFGGEEASAEELVRASADALDLADLLPRPMHTLSGGQRSRVFLARTMVQVAGGPRRVLALDEPDAAMDLAQKAKLMRVVRDAAAGGALVLVVSHDLSLAAAADEVVLLDHGRPTVGGPATVLTLANLSSAYAHPIRRSGDTFVAEA